jgi:hypothetical protein
MNIRKLLLTALVLSVPTSQALYAQSYDPYGYGYNQNYYSNSYGYPGNYSNTYGNSYNNPYSSYGYGSPYSSGNYGNSSNYRAPYPSGDYNTPYSAGNNDYNRGYNAPGSSGPTNRYSGQTYGNNYAYTPNYGHSYPRPYPAPAYKYKYKKKKKGSGMPFTGNTDFAEELWPGKDSIYEDIAPLDGPWDRGWGPAPWNRNYDDMWGKEGGPDAWFDPSDPKEGMAWMWEDALITPNRLGRMPGGWEAPSVVVPNPIDVGDEFKNAAGDFPGEVKDFSDGFTYGDRTITGSKPKSDGGSFGMGKDKDESSINIEPKVRR